MDIYDARVILGKTQKQLAEILGISERQVINLENGHTPMKKYVKLALRYLVDNMKGKQ